MVFKSSLNQNNGGGGVSATPVSASPYTAGSASGLNIFTIYNNSGSGFTFKLPAAPAVNEGAIIVDAALTAGTNTITIQGNGNTICAYGTTGSSIGIASNGGSAALIWDGTQWTQFA